MKCVSYNIHYGVGLDGRYDLARIVDAVREAEVIALQEVSRHNPLNGGRDMVAELRAALPGHFAVYGSNFQADIGSRIEDGRAVERFFELGNMVLSKTPIRMSRNLLLPRRRSYEHVNFQRGALEALIDAPFGPVRFYSVHLDHRGPEERLLQARFLRERLISYPLEGGGLSGLGKMGFPEPPIPDSFVAMGDFNMAEGSPEYAEMTGTPDPVFGTAAVATHAVDAALRAASAPDVTCIDTESVGENARRRIDYCFVSAGIAARIKASWVDDTAKGSDHLPVWTELG